MLLTKRFFSLEHHPLKFRNLMFYDGGTQAGDLRKQNDKQGRLCCLLCLHGEEKGEKYQIKWSAANSKKRGKDTKDQTDQENESCLVHRPGPDSFLIDGIQKRAKCQKKKAGGLDLPYRLLILKHHPE